jgi:hypothetical protein
MSTNMKCTLKGFENILGTFYGILGVDEGKAE